MALLIGAEAVIASRNTYWVLLNLVLGSIVVVYLVLYLIGIIGFFGDTLIPGLAWKIPTMIAIVVGNVFVITMSSAFLLPVLALQAICLIAGIIETVLIAFTVIGCLTGSPAIMCDSGDMVTYIFLGVVTLVYALALAYALLNIIDYLRGFNRIIRYLENEKAAQEYEDQVAFEEDL